MSNPTSTPRADGFRMQAITARQPATMLAIAPCGLARRHSSAPTIGTSRPPTSRL